MTTLKIPDLGGSSDVEVIEILVSEGDSVEKEQAVIVLETDKASMEIPVETSGTVSKLLIKVGDKVSEGDAYLELDSDSGASSAEDNSAEDRAAEDNANEAETASAESVDADDSDSSSEDEESSAAATQETVTINIPDLGGSSDVEVIELAVRVGDTVDGEQPIVTLETDKASMEIPAGVEGEVEELLVKLGDKVSQGDPMVKIKKTATAPAKKESSSGKESSTKNKESSTKDASSAKTDSSTSSEKKAAPQQESAPSHGESQSAETAEIPLSKIHAGPAVRKLAREFGVDLAIVRGTGPKNRVLKEDVQAFVKERVKGSASRSGSGTGSGIPSVPKVDFAKFGKISSEPLNNIKRATAKAMTIASLNVPQVTQFDEADITELEAFRKQKNQRGDVKFSVVPFVLKAIAYALKKYPHFNSSLSEDGESLIIKDYVHIGVAVDTPKGLLVPVIRDVDTKSVTKITQELSEKAELARAGKLSLYEMQGGCFSLSSLGGIGGTAFTPIVNPPEVAILGLSKSTLKPIWDGTQFVPRLMLPLSLSYDHRVVDGAEAARFSSYLVQCLEDLRELII